MIKTLNFQVKYLKYSWLRLKGAAADPVQRCCSPTAARSRRSTDPDVKRLIQHGVQLVGQVVKHVADVVQDGPC